MHGSFAMNAQLLSELQNLLTQGAAQLNSQNVDVLVCPVSVYLNDAAKHLADLGQIKLGAQNCSQYSEGAYTGEVSLAMLEEIGCQYVILGHSERRELFGETDDLIAQKFATCEASKIIPILCVGETLDQRQSGKTEELIARQIEVVIERAGIKAFDQSVIAYEPVWAIGTGETATPEQAQAVHAFIRGLLARHDPAIASKIQILYGGSVKPDNAETLFSQADIDGGLVGGASLDASGFADICKAAFN